MAVFGFADTAANMLISGLDVWKISNVGAADGFVSLGLLKDGRVSTKGVSETDTRKRNHAYGYTLEITAKMLYTDKAAVLNLLSAVSASGPLYQKITFVNGMTIKGQWGFSWKLISDKEFDGARYIEVKATIGQVFATNWAALWATPGVDGTPSGTLAAFAPATMYPGGSTSLKFKKTGETAETVGLYRDLKFEIGSKEAKKDSQGRQYNVGCEFKLEFDMLQSSSTEALLMDDVATLNSGFVITLSDGAIFDLSGLAGTDFDFRHDNDSDEFAVIHVTGTGVMTLAEYDSALT
jgi:hypothetical protein